MVNFDVKWNNVDFYVKPSNASNDPKRFLFGGHFFFLNGMLCLLMFTNINN